MPKFCLIGVTLNGTASSEITQRLLNIKLKPYSPSFFKPGLPYYGKVGVFFVKSPVSICLTMFKGCDTVAYVTLVLSSMTKLMFYT